MVTTYQLHPHQDNNRWARRTTRRRSRRIYSGHDLFLLPFFLLIEYLFTLGLRVQEPRRTADTNTGPRQNHGHHHHSWHVIPTSIYHHTSPPFLTRHPHFHPSPHIATSTRQHWQTSMATSTRQHWQMSMATSTRFTERKPRRQQTASTNALTPEFGARDACVSSNGYFLFVFYSVLLNDYCNLYYVYGNLKNNKWTENRWQGIYWYRLLGFFPFFNLFDAHQFN